MLNVFLLFINLTYAEDLSYSFVKVGEKVPFSGVIMTNEALAKMIATHESQIKTCELESETQLKLQKNDLDTTYKLYESRCENEKLMYQEMIEIRDNELKKDRMKDIIQRAAFFGGFALGAATSVGIVYSLNQN